MQAKIQQQYSNYVHEYAVWTASRAVQRGFVDTALLRQVLEAVNLRLKIAQLKNSQLSSAAFDDWHMKTSKKLIQKARILFKKESFMVKARIVSSMPEMTYGRAAKLIAIYIKTCETISFPISALGEFAHPPIDRKLLMALRGRFSDEFMGTCYEPWTQFNKKSYFETIAVLRQIQKREEMRYFWMIEKYCEA